MSEKELQNNKEKVLNEATNQLAQIFITLFDEKEKEPALSTLSTLDKQGATKHNQKN